MIQQTSVPRIDSISAENFLARYKREKQPVIIEQLSRSWPARQKWNLDYFKQKAGDNLVPLYDCVPSKDRSHQHACSQKMPLRDYLERLQQGHNDLRVFFYNILAGAPQLTDDFHYPDLGLKFFQKLPVLFIAGQGTRVQMHFDIDLADILLCHFGGHKRVLLFSPEQTPYMYHVPFSFSSLFDVDFETPDYKKYPALHYLKAEVADLYHGDVLYIPPGYWHFIIYEETSISMALRAFPRTPVNFLKMLKNLLFIRTTEGLMRKLFGKRWVERNERLAIEKTHRHLKN
jgi:hypothetical protein